MRPRRAQTPITIRSDRAYARLQALTLDGRSQAAVVEDALDRMPTPVSADALEERERRLARLHAIIARTSTRVPPIPTMADFDAREYDERGNPR